MFNRNDVMYGYELNGGDGSVTKNEEYFVSDYIKVYPGQKLYKSGSSAGTSNCFYDENKNFISTVRLVGGVISVPTTNSISYMRTNGLLTDLDSIQITSGDTQLAYEAYIEPKIFILNNNNIYEEFMKKDEETYLITNEAEHDGTSFYSLKRKENLVIFSFNALRIKNITQNTWFKICEIPNSIKPNVNFVPVILSGVINMGTGNIVGLAKLELRQDGGVYIKPNITYSDVGIFGTVSWFI